jgi:hypothetical protein
MSSNSTGTFRDTTAADYLNDVRKEQAANKFGKTSDSSNTPHTILPSSDIIEIDDDVSLNGNTHTVGDSVELSDAVAEPVALPTGQFQITNDAGGGAGVTQPGIISFSDMGA